MSSSDSHKVIPLATPFEVIPRTQGRSFVLRGYLPKCNTSVPTQFGGEIAGRKAPHVTPKQTNVQMIASAKQILIVCTAPFRLTESSPKSSTSPPCCGQVSHFAVKAAYKLKNFIRL